MTSKDKSQLKPSKEALNFQRTCKLGIFSQGITFTTVRQRINSLVLDSIIHNLDLNWHYLTASVSY